MLIGEFDVSHLIFPTSIVIVFYKWQFGDLGRLRFAANVQGNLLTHFTKGFVHIPHGHRPTHTRSECPARDLTDDIAFGRQNLCPFPRGRPAIGLDTDPFARWTRLKLRQNFIRTRKTSRLAPAF